MTRIPATALAVALAAAGCAAPRAAIQVPVDQVVELQADRVKRCRSLGAVHGSQANGEGISENCSTSPSFPFPNCIQTERGRNARYAVEDVRRQVAHMGGNAFVVTRRSDTMLTSAVDADAYLCPSWEPVPGLAPR